MYFHSFFEGIMLRKLATVQDVIVSCCIIHNMRKFERIQQPNYTQDEVEQQANIGRNVLIIAVSAIHITY